MKTAKFTIISCIAMMSLADPQDCYAAHETVTIRVGGVKDFPDGNPYPKSPVLIPSASIDGHTFSISSYHADYTLVLVDEYDAVVYTTFFPSTLTEVELPSTLSGDYELRLYPGGSCKFPFTPYF